MDSCVEQVLHEQIDLHLSVLAADVAHSVWVQWDGASKGKDLEVLYPIC